MNRLKMAVTLAASAFFQIGLNAGEIDSSSVPYFIGIALLGIRPQTDRY